MAKQAPENRQVILLRLLKEPRHAGRASCGNGDVHREASVTQGRLAADEAGLPEPSPLPADELIAGLAAEQPGEIHLLTIGAVTNLGYALVRFPDMWERSWISN